MLLLERRAVRHLWLIDAQPGTASAPAPATLTSNRASREFQLSHFGLFEREEVTLTSAITVKVDVFCWPVGENWHLLQLLLL